MVGLVASPHNRHVVDVRLLGPVSLVSGGALVPLGGPKQRAVLALLALKSPRLTTTDQLIDAVWGADAPDSARNAVQVYISGLRKALGKGAQIERAGDAYRLVGSDLSVDAGAFVTAVAEGRSALRAGDASRARRVLAEALRLWVGEPLSGVESQPFHAEACQQLIEARAAARLDHAESLLRENDYSAAQEEARAAISEHPYEEQAWSVLARAQYLSGRQRDALDTCRRLRATLADELGIDPSPALAQLEVSILNQDVPTKRHPDGRDSAVEPEAHRLPQLPDPFVGRESLVQEAIDRLASNPLVSLVGLGGIGKTTVARAVAHRLVADGRVVHFCELETETTARAALERVCRVVGIDADPADMSFAGLPRGVVVVLDNVEQISGFGHALASAVKGSEACWLVTSRRPLRLRSEAVVLVGPLSLDSDGGLPSAAASLFLALAERVHPGLDRSAALHSGERVCEMLDGIPLAIELTASRTRVLTVDQIATRLQVGASSVLGESRRVDVPARQVSLGAIVGATIEALGSPASNLLDWLVSMDGWTSLELVETILKGEQGAHLMDCVEDLVDSGLIDADDDGRVRVRTPIRDFVGRQGDRSARDLAVIEVVAALVEEVAPTLFGRASGTGLGLLERDADTVAGSLSRAVDQGLPNQAAAITLGLNRFWLLTGRWSEARRSIEATMALPTLDAEDRVRLQILAGTFGSYANDPAAPRRLHEALEQGPVLGLTVDRLVVNGWCCLAATAAQRGEAEAAEAHAAEAGRLAAITDDPTLKGLARDVFGFVAAHVGNFEGALDATMAGLTEARQSGDTYDVVNLLSAAAEDLVSLNRYDEALIASTEAFELMRDLPGSPLLGQVLVHHATSLVAVGRVAESRGMLTEALRIARDQFPNPMAMGDRLSILAVAAALERSDELAARLWGAAEALLGDQGTSGRKHLPPSFLVHIDDLSERLGTRFSGIVMVGAATPTHVIEALLA